MAVAAQVATRLSGTYSVLRRSIRPTAPVQDDSLTVNLRRHKHLPSRCRGHYSNPRASTLLADRVIYSSPWITHPTPGNCPTTAEQTLEHPQLHLSHT